MVPSRVAERHSNKQCNGDGESKIALSTEKKISQTTSKHFNFQNYFILYMNVATLL